MGDNGDLFGHFDQMPFIKHSGDEKTGDAAGDDESLTINGQQWPKIKQILIYTYIYEGGKDWSQIRPQMTFDLKNDNKPLEIKPALKASDFPICALATIKNVKNGIQIVTHGEYFMSQPAMDRAFGYGLQWEDGAKD